MRTAPRVDTATTLRQLATLVSPVIALYALTTTKMGDGSLSAQQRSMPGDQPEPLLDEPTPDPRHLSEHGVRLLHDQLLPNTPFAVRLDQASAGAVRSTEQPTGSISVSNSASGTQMGMGASKLSGEPWDNSAAWHIYQPFAEQAGPPKHQYPLSTDDARSIFTIVRKEAVGLSSQAARIEYLSGWLNALMTATNRDWRFTSEGFDSAGTYAFLGANGMIALPADRYGGGVFCLRREGGGWSDYLYGKDTYPGLFLSPEQNRTFVDFFKVEN